MDELVDCLRGVPAGVLAEAASNYTAADRLEGGLGFGGLIPCAQSRGSDRFYDADAGDRPEALLAAGDYRELPVMFGANSHEGSYVYGVVYNGFLGPLDVEADRDFLKYGFVDLMFRGLHVDEGFALRKYVDNYYYQPHQLGDLEAMVPGTVDVRNKTNSI